MGVVGRILAVAAAAIVLVPSAAGSQPKWGDRAIIVQAVSVVQVADRGNWFVEGGGAVDRFVIVWTVTWPDGRQLVVGKPPEQRQRPDEPLPSGYDAFTFRLLPTMIGAEIRATLYGGTLSAYPDGQWIEWGGANARSGERPMVTYPLLVRDWRGRASPLLVLARRTLDDVRSGRVRVASPR